MTFVGVERFRVLGLFVSAYGAAQYLRAVGCAGGGRAGNHAERVSYAVQRGDDLGALSAAERAGEFLFAFLCTGWNLCSYFLIPMLWRQRHSR